MNHVLEFWVCLNGVNADFLILIESLDRRSGPSLLPDADRPKLVGPARTGPLLSVVGHDPVTFAELSQKMMGTPKSLTMTFTNP